MQKGGKGSPSAGAHVDDARFWRANGRMHCQSCGGRRFRGGYCLGEGGGNCRAQESHPPASALGEHIPVARQGGGRGKAGSPVRVRPRKCGRATARKMEGHVRRMTSGSWSTGAGCECILTTGGGGRYGVTHQWRVRRPPQTGVGAQSRAPMSRQAQVGRGFAVCGGTDV